MEHKFLALDLKAEDDTRTIEGFGSIFNNEDSGGDIVLPGAFVETLKRRQPVMLWQHNTDEPIGVWSEYAETDKGLRVKGTIFDTARGNDAYKLVKGGAIKGLSIGYSTKRYEIDKSDEQSVRKLLELELYEVSLVTFPMNEKATITRVKNAHANERDFEEFLREAGYPRDAAKIITARGFKALSGQREAGAGGLSHEQNAELSALFRSFSNHLPK